MCIVLLVTLRFLFFPLFQTLQLHARTPASKSSHPHTADSYTRKATIVATRLRVCTHYRLYQSIYGKGTSVTVFDGICGAFCILRFVFCVLRFAFCVLRFAFCVLRFTFYVLRFAFYVLRFAFSVKRFVSLDCAFDALGSAFSFVRFGGAVVYLTDGVGCGRG